MSLMQGYPVPRAQWVSSGEACTACGKRFSFFTSKENCPCCGRLFCSSCLSAECTLTPMGLPSAICLECFQRIQDWRRSNRDAKPTLSPTPAYSNSPPTASAAEQRLNSFETELAQVKESGRRLREENDSLVDLLAAKDTCIAELTTEQKKADASVEQAQQQLRASTAARADVAKALSELQVKLSAAQEAKESMTEKMDALIEANKALKGRVVELEGEVAENRASSSRHAEELTRLRDAASEASMQSAKEAEDTKAQLQALSTENAGLRHDRDDAATKAAKTLAELEKLREAAQSWEAERSTHQEEVKRLQLALESAQAKADALEQQRHSAAQEAESTTAVQLTEKQQVIDALTRQSDEMRADIQELQRQKGNVEDSLQLERQTRTDFESRVVALKAEVDRYQEKEQQWSAATARNTEQIAGLTAAAERATRQAAEAQQQHLDAAKQMESSVASQLADKQQTIDSLTQQLNAAEEKVRTLEAEIISTQQTVSMLQEQLHHAADVGETTLTASLAEATAAHEATRQLLRQREESNATLASQLSSKTQELEDLQRLHRTATCKAKDELELLRQQCTAARAIYEADRQGWQSSLTELRGALEELEKQHAAEMASCAPAAAAQAEGSPNSGGCKGSRWAQLTRVKDVCYPVCDVQQKDIPAVTGLDRWEFDTVAEAARATEPDTLVRIGYQIALDWLLFPSAASLQRWVNLLDAVQVNYCANPYHNKVHAADVLQGVYALVLQVPGLFAHMTRMEKRAIVFAAAVHDVRHPGRTEAFLRSTFDATYLHYNGCHVLEQMHTATAFELLGRDDLDFTQDDMDDAEALRFHGLVATLIAGTYMGSHATLMQAWSRPLRESGASFDVTEEADRHTVLTMLLHAADIGAQSRGVDVALKWLGVVEEMYQQGDEEAALGLPVSPGNSRGGDLKRGQLFFMEMFVIPLFDLIHQLFPAVEAPMRHLRALHTHYSDALQEAPPRPFPPPVAYDAEMAKARAEKAAAETRNAALAKREAKVAKREKTLEQAVQRLRQAAATVAQREAQLAEKEKEVQRESTSRVLDTSHTSQQTEAELLRATNAVVQREEAVQRKAAELEKMTAELEQREAVTSQLSSQLASIAERVNQRRQLLHYREARMRAKEEAAAVALHDAGGEDGRANAEVFRATSKEPTATSQPHLSLSPQCAAEMNKLKSALDKLNSAMSFM